MNYTVVFKLLGIIMCVLEVSFITSYLVGYHFEENIIYATRNGWHVAIVLNFLLICIFFFLGRKSNNKILKKEAFAVIGVGWLLASLVGAFPYYFVLKDCLYVDAVFETASGLTTTGATIFKNIEILPKSILFWRTMSQWIGGLGIVVFFVAILSFLGAGAKILYSRESSGNSEDFTSARVQSGILSILFIYIALSVLCAVFYYYGGMNLFDAVCHMFATVSTGGFGNYNASMAFYGSPFIEWSAIAFMLLGGTNFLLILGLFRLRFSKIKDNEEFLAYLSFILIFSVLLFVSVYRQENINPDGLFRTSLFQVVSIMTTTGFSSIDFDLFLPVAHVLLLISMLLGGSSGSTAGGVKIIRVIVALKISFYNVEKTIRKRIVHPFIVNGKTLSESVRENIVVYLVVVTIVGIISLFILALIEPQMSLEGDVSTIFACLFNIGPGFAEIGPSKNYAFMHTWTKYFLSLVMIAGRLELYAILALMLPSLWKKFE